ncbi:MAG TPA: hypothetical protein VF457_15615 [Burkholderiaceae bacterium]
MASQTDICNRALIKLGGLRITSLDDPSKQARVLSALWDASVDAELADHPWAFAATRALIPSSSTPPPFGWAAAYPLPAGFLKMIEIGEDWVFYTPTFREGLFTIEGAAVLTDQGSPLKIRYVQRITNAGLFPPLFVDSLACRLAAEACESLTQDLSKRQAALQERTEALRKAKRTNDIQMPPQRGAPNSWERSLYGLEG